jgi:hypothetical protein
LAVEITATMSVGINRISRKARVKARLGSASWSAVIHLGTLASPRPRNVWIAARASRPATIQSAVVGLPPPFAWIPIALTIPNQIRRLSEAATTTPLSIATEFLTGSRLVTRKIAVRICGPITMIRASGRICSDVVVEDKSRPR